MLIVLITLLGVSFILLLVTTLLFCDRMNLWFYPVSDPTGQQLPLGLLRSMRNALGQSERLPQIRVFSDPQPHVLVFRGLLGPGLILLSQGCIALLNEDELAYVLSLGKERLQNWRSVSDSVYWFFARLFAQIAPSQWISFVYCDKPPPFGKPGVKSKGFTPFSALIFWGVLPFLEFFRKRGKETDLLWSHKQKRQLVSLDKKLTRTASLAGGQSFLELRLLSSPRRS